MQLAKKRQTRLEERPMLGFTYITLFPPMKFLLVARINVAPFGWPLRARISEIEIDVIAGETKERGLQCSRKRDKSRSVALSGQR